MPAAEVGPQRFRDPDFGIGNLPQEKIADAHLAARPDQQIGIGLAGCVEELAEPAFVQIVRVHAGGDQTLGCVHDFRPAAVIQRDVEQQARVVRGLTDAHVELVADVGRELVLTADHPKPDVVLVERGQLQAQIALEQRHQRVDLGPRAFPVLHRKRVQRQHADAETRRRLDDIPHRIDSGTVSLDPRQVTLRRPTAVAIHDDGDVRGQLLEIHLARHRLIRRSWRRPRQELVKRHGPSFEANLDNTRC